MRDDTGIFIDPIAGVSPDAAAILAEVYEYEHAAEFAHAISHVREYAERMEQLDRRGLVRMWDDVCSEDEVADIMSKNVKRPIFLRLRPHLVVNLPALEAVLVEEGVSQPEAVPQPE